MELRVRVHIEPVQILVENVHPIMPMIDPIRVQHWHQHEHEILPQKHSPCILRQQEGYDPVHDMTTWGFSWMHPGSHQHYLLRGFELVGSIRVGEESVVYSFLPIALLPIMGSDCNQVDVP